MKLIFTIATGRRSSRRKVGWAAAIPAIASIAGGLISANAAKKAAEGANNLQYQPIDLTKLQSDAQANAIDNAQKSLALEAQLQPGVAAARTGLQDQVSEDLNSGGLPVDVINQVTRGSVAGANTAGLIGGGGPLTAASLGLTAMQVRNQNQAKAASLLAANPLPQVGLDPGQLAGAAVGNQQNAQQFGLSKLGAVNSGLQSTANAYGGLVGGLGQLGSAIYSHYSAPTTVSTGDNVVG